MNIFDAIDDQEASDIHNILKDIHKECLNKTLSTAHSYLSDFDKKKNKPRFYPLTAIQFAATTTADDIFKVLLDWC